MHRCFSWNLFLVLLATSGPSFARPASELGATGSEYRARRQQVLEEMKKNGGDNAVLLLRAPRKANFSGDVDYPYRPDNDLYYLTGIPEPGCALLLSVAEFQGGHELLFYSPQDPAHVIWEGKRLDAKASSSISGVAEEQVREAESLPDLLAEVFFSAPFLSNHGSLHSRRTFYFLSGSGFAPGEPPGEGYLFLIESLGSAAFFQDLRDPGTLVHPLRQIKSASELRQMQRAIDVTCEALRNAMRIARPHLFEYELRATIEKTFIERGCDGWSFPCIVGSGPNSCILHYQKYDRQAGDDELGLMDVGAEFSFYAADVTRTIPLNGRFTKRQRAVYEVVLRAQQNAIEAIRPGVQVRTVHDTAREEISKSLEELGLEGNVDKYFPHGTSHGLGLNVHDPMPNETLAVGMVITVEPGIYISKESIGIRIEDDVLVTQNGSRVLSESAPKDPDAIEELMRNKKF